MAITEPRVTPNVTKVTLEAMKNTLRAIGDYNVEEKTSHGGKYVYLEYEYHSGYIEFWFNEDKNLFDISVVVLL